jgi:hypothetical protein
MMTISITLSSTTEEKLKERAAITGQDVAGYVASIVERTVGRPISIEEISGPIARDFRDSGMTEDELGDFLEDVKHKMRRERQTGPQR